MSRRKQLVRFITIMFFMLNPVVWSGALCCLISRSFLAGFYICKEELMKVGAWLQEK